MDNILPKYRYFVGANYIGTVVSSDKVIVISERVISIQPLDFLLGELMYNKDKIKLLTEEQFLLAAQKAPLWIYLANMILKRRDSQLQDFYPPG